VSYATAQDLVDRFGEPEMIQLTNGPADPHEEVIAANAAPALADAAGTVDSYLRPRYRLPLAAVPVRIKTICCDIARFFLMHGGQREPTAQAKDAYDRAIAWLKDIAAGKADLGLDALGATAPESAGARVTTRPGRAFSRDSMAGW
jgi:phage gp36-like protein